MLTTQIRLDEFTRGYQGRLRVLNLFPSTLSLMAALRDAMHSPETPSAEYPAAVTLALAADMPLQQFVQNHSLLPFHRAVPKKDANVNHGDPSRLDLISLLGTRVWRRLDAKFCLDCVKDDLDKGGFSYWHRSHQLPGFHFCLRHGTQLVNNPDGKKAFDEMPSIDMATQYEFTEQDFLAVYANPVIGRYVRIVNGFLCSERPMSLIHARHLIAKQFKKHQLRIGKTGGQPTLTDRALEQIPLPWLRAQYPSIDSRLKGEFFNPIDNISLGSAASQDYALALAVLFESSDEALNYWFGIFDGLPAVQKVQCHYGPDYWNSEAVFKLYVEHSGNHNNIGETLGVDPFYTRLELNAAGLPALGQIDMRTTGRAILDFHEGMSIMEACESNGASQEEVEKLLRSGASKISSAIKEIIQPEIRKNAKPTKS